MKYIKLYLLSTIISVAAFSCTDELILEENNALDFFQKKFPDYYELLDRSELDQEKTLETINGLVIKYISATLESNSIKGFYIELDDRIFLVKEGGQSIEIHELKEDGIIKEYILSYDEEFLMRLPIFDFPAENTREIILRNEPCTLGHLECMTNVAIVAINIALTNPSPVANALAVIYAATGEATCCVLHCSQCQSQDEE